MKALPVFGLLVFLLGADMPAPTFVNVPAVRSAPEHSLYGDILSHARQPDYHDTRGTTAHETVHGINGDASHGMYKRGFYVGAGKAVLIDCPKVSRRDAAKALPAGLRGPRFRLYFESMGPGYWREGSQIVGEETLFILDEATAYWMGGRVCVEDAQRGAGENGTDAVCGCVEFSIYAAAFAKHVKEHDATYWERTPNFQRYVSWLMKHACETFIAGRKYYPFPDQERLLSCFLRSPDAASLRAFVTSDLGNAWLERFKP